MKFTITAYKSILGLDNDYRLKKDGGWIQQADYTSFNGREDMYFRTFNDAQQWLHHTGNVLINGEIANTIPKESSSVVNPDYSFEIIAHRFSKPANLVPTRAQLKDIIAGGNDRYHNALVIDSNGKFKLIELINQSTAELQNFPVRYETFQPGNGYVGYSASNDELFIEQTYITLLEAWWLHLNTGRYFYRDYSDGEYPNNDLMDNILTRFENLS